MKEGIRLTTRYPPLMGKASSKQKTPKGAEIPIPTRKEFYSDLDKVVKASASVKKSRKEEAQHGGDPGGIVRTN
jgi:hypothetical protein